MAETAEHRRPSAGGSEGRRKRGAAAEQSRSGKYNDIYINEQKKVLLGRCGGPRTFAKRHRAGSVGDAKSAPTEIRRSATRETNGWLRSVIIGIIRTHGVYGHDAMGSADLCGETSATCDDWLFNKLNLTLRNA